MQPQSKPYRFPLWSHLHESRTDVLYSHSTLLDILQDRLLDGCPYSVRTLGLRTTSANSIAVHRETCCCKPILPILVCLLQLNNVTLALLADLYDLLGMVKTVIAVDGQSTDVACAHDLLARISSDPSYRSVSLFRPLFFSGTF